VLAALARHGPVAAWVVDDTGMPKKGRHSVGVARQYCGVLGKQDNCQVAVSLSLAHERASVPVAYRLYLPETWAQDRRRRRAAGVPDAIEFRTKWQIALAQVAQIAAEGVPAAPVVADAGYGVVTAFRDALTAQAIPYVVGISTETTVWAPGRAPLPPPKYRGHGRPPTLVRRTGRHRPLSVRALAQQLPARAWRKPTATSPKAESSMKGPRTGAGCISASTPDGPGRKPMRSSRVGSRLRRSSAYPGRASVSATMLHS